MFQRRTYTELGLNSSLKFVVVVVESRQRKDSWAYVAIKEGLCGITNCRVSRLGRFSRNLGRPRAYRECPLWLCTRALEMEGSCSGPDDHSQWVKKSSWFGVLCGLLYCGLVWW